jgi:hypothetical protein
LKKKGVEGTKKSLIGEDPVIETEK